MDMNEEKKIIQETLSGNDEAFAGLLNHHLKPVYNFLYQLSKDRSVSDDLTQETFLKAWKNLKRFDRNKSFKTWVFTIAKNTAYDYFKKKKTIPFSNFTDEEGNNKLDNITDENILPDEILDRKDIAKELEEKLKQLPEHYRLILTLHYQEDLSLSEIAEILNLPYNTVKSQHGRGLNKLKRIF